MASWELTAACTASQSGNAHILIQGNTIDHNDYAHFNPGFGSGGFKVGATSGVVLRGNIIRNNEGAGIHFDEDSQNEFVDGNIITDNSDAARVGAGTRFRDLDLPEQHRVAERRSFERRQLGLPDLGAGQFGGDRLLQRNGGSAGPRHWRVGNRCVQPGLQPLSALPIPGHAPATTSITTP